MIPLPLTKTLHPDDYTLLAEELHLVDTYFTSEREQHPHRRWEYAMALRAVHTQFCTGCDLRPREFYDVGGAGSPLRHMIHAEGHHVLVVDPDQRPSPTTCDLKAFIRTNPQAVDGVFCLSVLEHVPEDETWMFLKHLASLVRPGGILVLTFDCCNHARHALDVPDPHHFSWMRSQIFHWPAEVISEVMNSHRMPSLGMVDPRYHGDQVYDYTFGVRCFFKLEQEG